MGRAIQMDAAPASRGVMHHLPCIMRREDFIKIQASRRPATATEEPVDEPVVHKTYLPDTGRCLGCQKFNVDCRALPFRDMEKIYEFPNGKVIVRCTEFIRARD